ncbi:ABC transporter substrate-binding protein [Pilimelia columellifera]|uniref:Leucine-binding protein domain-containing protein n=1 Tax=Pilimelia columellifera subsp. columellifera TaxID=706583 RepID=A0ABN3N240_9ACTN
MRSRRSAGAALLAASLTLLAAGGCSDSSAEGRGAPMNVRIYGADGNMNNSFGESFAQTPGALAGMKGTTPLTQLPEDFKSRLRAVDDKLTDFTYSAEAYDAVVISVLAAELAGTSDSRQLARFVNSVTNGGELCDTVKSCLKLATKGRDLRYRGMSLRRSGFTDAGEPSTASYATLHFGERDQIDDGKTEFVGAGDETASSRAQAPATSGTASGGGPLRIGGLLPQTGDGANVFPPMRAGAALAIQEVNAAGGALGASVQWLDGDDGTKPEVAKRTVAAHIARDVNVIIGPATSGVARAVLPDVVRAGLVLFSPSNTAADLSSAQDEGLYFRTAPSDALQGTALADVIMRDGAQKVVIIARDDAYGVGLQENVRAALLSAGRSEDHIKTMRYPLTGDGPVDFGAGAREVRGFAPDSVLVIGLSESAAVIRAMAQENINLRS